MTDEEMACKAICDSIPCKTICTKCKCYIAGLEYKNKENAELEEKISILLSCKNCPENKGGWICAKEYENKCLAQKIEFIKELEKEKCELLGIIQGKDKVIQELKKELKKANEWHEIESKTTPKREISKQYMPKNKEKVLLKYHFSGDDEIHISDGYYDAYDFEFHIANNPKFRIVCVIAWKEIVLPKEIEENA